MVKLVFSLKSLAVDVAIASFPMSAITKRLSSFDAAAPTVPLPQKKSATISPSSVKASMSLFISCSGFCVA